MLEQYFRGSREHVSIVFCAPAAEVGQHFAKFVQLCPTMSLNLDNFGPSLGPARVNYSTCPQDFLGKVSRCVSLTGCWRILLSSG